MNYKTKALELANTLFELEGESIFNDPVAHWFANDWIDKYGEDSIVHKDFAYPEKEVQALADILYDDYKNNYIDTLEYQYQMPDAYGGFITKVFEKELASKTKVGFQLEILN